MTDTPEPLSKADEERIEHNRKRRAATSPRGTLLRVGGADDHDAEVIGHGVCRFCQRPAPITRFLRNLVVVSNRALESRGEKKLTRDDVALCGEPECRRAWETERDVHVHRLDLLVDDCLAKAGRGEPFRIPDLIVKNRPDDLKRIKAAVWEQQNKRTDTAVAKSTGKLK